MNNNKDFLFKYKIVYSSDFGRYLIASQDIPEKSLILIEEPLIIAPADEVQSAVPEKPLLCLNCFAPMSSHSELSSTENIPYTQRCTSCRWPLCTPNCEKMRTHCENECKIFTENKVTFPPPHCWPILNKTILVLRCLLLKDNNPRAWKEFIGRLEHHSDVRKEKIGCYKGDEMIIRNIHYFYESLGKCPFTEEEIQIVSGVINVNAFCAIKTDEITGITRRAKCLFEKASLLAHSCSPNCSWDISINNHLITNSTKDLPKPPEVLIQVSTAVPIAKGDILTIFYSTRYALFGTLKRIVSMEEIAHFICKCRRCKDPTELDTFVSAVKCFDCENDYLLPEDPMTPESQWKCQDSKCGRRQNVSKIVYMVCKVEDHVEKIKNMNLAPNDEVEKLNQIFIKYSTELLHKNHYVIQEISTRILHVLLEDMNILNQDKNTSSEINVPLVELFIYHCNYLLETAVVLLPAMTGYIDTLEIYLEHAERIKRKNI